MSICPHPPIYSDRPIYPIPMITHNCGIDDFQTKTKRDHTSKNLKITHFHYVIGVKLKISVEINSTDDIKKNQISKLAKLYTGNFRCCFFRFKKYGKIMKLTLMMTLKIVILFQMMKKFYCNMNNNFKTCWLNSVE